MKEIRLGDKVFVTDKNSRYHLMSGTVIAIYDAVEFSREVTVRLIVKEKSSTKKFTKIGFMRSQLSVIDGSLRYYSRCHLYRAISSGRISGQEIVDIIRDLRDKGYIEINLPSN